MTSIQLANGHELKTLEKRDAFELHVHRLSQDDGGGSIEATVRSSEDDVQAVNNSAPMPLCASRSLDEHAATMPEVDGGRCSAWRENSEKGRQSTAWPPGGERSGSAVQEAFVQVRSRNTEGSLAPEVKPSATLVWENRNVREERVDDAELGMDALDLQILDAESHITAMEIAHLGMEVERETISVYI